MEDEQEKLAKLNKIKEELSEALANFAEFANLNSSDITKFTELFKKAQNSYMQNYAIIAICVIIPLVVFGKLFYFFYDGVVCALILFKYIYFELNKF